MTDKEKGYLKGYADAEKAHKAELKEVIKKKIIIELREIIKGSIIKTPTNDVQEGWNMSSGCTVSRLDYILGNYTEFKNVKDKLYLQLRYSSLARFFSSLGNISNTIKSK